MAWIEQLDDEEATGSLARAYQAARRRAGRVSGIVRLMSLSPDVLKSSMRFYVSLMKGDGPLPPATRELIATVVSRANGCHY